MGAEGVLRGCLGVTVAGGLGGTVSWGVEGVDGVDGKEGVVGAERDGEVPLTASKAIE